MKFHGLTILVTVVLREAGCGLFHPIVLHYKAIFPFFVEIG